ncbi:MAG: PH domain-containing protein [Armatimonadota bacterium]
MASDKGVPKDGMDERLAQARDAALQDGEAIVAQETGDQGQAIVITNSRILIIKTGLTATGTLNGLSVGAFAYADISAVNVRKGPMGAVIQIQTNGAPKTAASGPPDNVIVFSGDQRVAKCDTIAQKIESALGKKAERFEPKTGNAAPAAKEQPAEQAVEIEGSNDDTEQAPKPMKGGRQAKSLAEEMFEEMTSSEPEAPKPEPTAAEPVIEQVAKPALEPPVKVEAESNVTETPAAEEAAYRSIEELGYEDEEEDEQTDEPAESFRPNPNLPKPVRKKNSSKNSFVLIGGLMALVLIGMAVTTPLRNPKPVPKVEINVDKLTRNAKTVRLQISEIGNYRNEVVKALAASDKETAALSLAVHSGRKAIVGAAGKNSSEAAWQDLTILKAPSGLADAQENIVLGAFTRKNAVANALSVGPIDATNILKRLSEADSLIKKGLGDIDKMEAGLKKQWQPVQAKPAAGK